MTKVILGVLIIDRPKTTDMCMQQLLKWNRQGLTIVMCDNNSNEETKEVIEKYRKDVDLIMTYPCNTGCVFPMNAYMALRLPGQHFMKIDVDAHIQTPDWLEQMLGVAEEKDIGIIMGRRPTFWSERRERQIYFGQSVKLERRGRYYLEITDDIGAVWPWGMIKSEVIDTIGYLNEAMCIDDIEYCPRAHAVGFKSAYVPDVMIYQHYHQLGHPFYEEQHHPQYGAYHDLLTKYSMEYREKLWDYRSGKDLWKGTRFKPETINDPEYKRRSDENWEFFHTYGKQPR